MKMNKKLVSAIAVASAAVLACTPVFAASSSTTTNTNTAAKTETTTTAPAVVSTKTAAIVGNGTAIATTDGARISGNTAQMSDKKVATTVKQTVASTDANASADSVIAQALMSQVNALAPNASKVFGPYKYQFYKAGVAITDGFGTFTTSFGVGNAYEGKTATVFQIMKDGTITATQVTVNNGKIAYNMTNAGSIAVVFQ